MPPPSFLSRPTGTALRYAVSLAALGWLASRVAWTDFDGLGALDWRFAGPAVLVAGLAYPLQAWRWRLLLRAQELNPPARWVHGVFWLGQFWNSFLPGGIAGDAVRFVWLHRLAPDRPAANAASLVADRLIGLGALCSLAVLALGLQLARPDSPAGLRGLLGAGLAAFALLLAGGWFAARAHWWEPLAARLLGADHAAELRAAVHALHARPATLAAAAGLSVAVWLADFLSLWLLARAVGLAAGPLAITVAAAAAYLAAALPISIGGHGIREGALVTVLAWLGFSGGPVPLLALACWGVAVGWSLAGGVVYPLSRLTGWPLPATAQLLPAPSARNSKS